MYHCGRKDLWQGSYEAWNENLQGWMVSTECYAKEGSRIIFSLVVKTGSSETKAKTSSVKTKTETKTGIFKTKTKTDSAETKTK